jgi:hypothetical protein
LSPSNFGFPQNYFVLLYIKTKGKRKELKNKKTKYQKTSDLVDENKLKRYLYA